MNNMDLLKAFGDIDDKYLIEENEIEETNRIETNKKVGVMKKFKLSYVLAPVCCVAIVLAITIFTSEIFTKKLETTISKNDKWIIKEVQTDSSTNNTEMDSALVPKWDERPISDQYYEAKYNNNTYSSRKTKISKDKLSKNIGSTTLNGYDTYTKIKYNKKAELYSIKDISEKCAIAVQFENDNDYYVYVNSYYRPETLGQFIDDLNLKNITSFGTVYYNYWDTEEKNNEEYNKIEFYNVDNSIIWKMLFSDINLENVYSDTEIGKYVSERFSSEISISVDIPILGYKNISVSLTDKGYLLTNILDTGKAFYVGEDKIKEFLSYITDNYDGYKIVYIDQNEKEELDSEENEDDSIVMYDKTNNTVSNVTVNINKNSTNSNSTPAYNPTAK